jgi:hypothetical protein
MLPPVSASAREKRAFERSDRARLGAVEIERGLRRSGSASLIHPGANPDRLDLDRRAARQRVLSMDEVLQLAHVAGPVIAEDPAQAVGMERFCWKAVARAVDANEMPGQEAAMTNVPTLTLS